MGGKWEAMGGWQSYSGAARGRSGCLRGCRRGAQPGAPRLPTASFQVARQPQLPHADCQCTLFRILAKHPLL